LIQEAMFFKVYNFKVDDFHTYHVGKKGILVHNADYNPKMGFDDLDLEKATNKQKGNYGEYLADDNLINNPLHRMIKLQKG